MRRFRPLVRHHGSVRGMAMQRARAAGKATARRADWSRQAAEPPKRIRNRPLQRNTPRMEWAAATATVQEAGPLAGLAELRRLAASSPCVAQLQRLRLLSEHAAGPAQLESAAGVPRSVAQLIKVGKNTITTAAALAPLLHLDDGETVLRLFNAQLGDFAPANIHRFNTFLAAKKGRVHRGNTSHPAAYLALLAKHYKRQYIARVDSGFAANLAQIEDDEDYQRLIDPEGINYLEGEDDGASVKDHYDVALACSLYALLQLKPGFLGADTPEQLHHVLRSDPRTAQYDNDQEVAQIRIAAGLRYRAPAEGERTVSGYTRALTVADRARKFIIDPEGEAHTFVLAWQVRAWKQVDNDHPAGTALNGATRIRAVWHR